MLIKKIGIVDTLTLTLNDAVYGHFHKVSLQLLQILSENLEVKVLGGRTYSKYFDESKIEILPYFTRKVDLDNKSFFIKVKTKIKSFFNTIAVLRNRKYDVLIFHDNNQTLLYFLLLFFKPNSHIVLIRYTKNNTSLSNRLFNKIKCKISFIISSLESVAISYGIDYILLPDYLPVKTSQQELPKPLYDFVLIGTINECKDIEDVLESVLNSSLTLKIAGHFENEEQYNKLLSTYGSSERISITNKYLTEEEYECFIKIARFILLPYKTDSYSNRSSGVILDAIYSGRPVIGSNIDAFQIINEREIGFVYKSSLADIISLVSTCNYNNLLKNVTECRKIFEHSSELLFSKINDLK
jgi:glycosyltransferase involved in cell wall biosynthesis